MVRVSSADDVLYSSSTLGIRSNGVTSIKLDSSNLQDVVLKTTIITDKAVAGSRHCS